MKYRLNLPNGKTSKQYTKQQLLELDEKGLIPEGSEVLLATDYTTWLKTETEDQSGPATTKQMEFATSLGVPLLPGITKNQISLLIDAALKEQHEKKSERWDDELRLKNAKAAALDEAIKEGHVKLLSGASLDDLLEECGFLEDAPENCGMLLLRYDLSEYEDVVLWVQEGCDASELPSLKSLTVNACDNTDGTQFANFIHALAILIQK